MDIHLNTFYFNLLIKTHAGIYSTQLCQYVPMTQIPHLPFPSDPAVPLLSPTPPEVSFCPLSVTVSQSFSVLVWGDLRPGDKIFRVFRLGSSMLSAVRHGKLFGRAVCLDACWNCSHPLTDTVRVALQDERHLLRLNIWERPIFIYLFFFFFLIWDSWLWRKYSLLQPRLPHPSDTDGKAKQWLKIWPVKYFIFVKWML